MIGATAYKAGFCIEDPGTSFDRLGYVNCPTSFPASQTYIWNGTYAANSYLTWEWIAPSGARRNWQHYGTGNGARHFASKWGATTSCGGSSP